MAKYRDKIHKVMSEYKHGTLHSGSKSGPKVKSRKQAVAIAMSEAREHKDKRAHTVYGKGYGTIYGPKVKKARY